MTDDDAQGITGTDLPADDHEETEAPATVDASIKVTGSIPKAEDGASGRVRFTAVVDLVFDSGKLIEINFGAAQYVAFKPSFDRDTLAIKSEFPKRKR